MNIDLITKEFQVFLTGFRTFQKVLFDKGMINRTYDKLSVREQIELYDIWFRQRGIALNMKESNEQG